MPRHLRPTVAKRSTSAHEMIRILAATPHELVALKPAGLLASELPCDPLADSFVRRLAAHEAIKQRRTVVDAAYAAHPQRFFRKPPQPVPAPTAVWINKPQPSENKSQ